MKHKRPSYLIIAPMKPPYTGNALPVRLIYDSFKTEVHVKVIDLTKKGFKSGIDSFSRIRQIVVIIFKVLFSSFGKDVIYLTVAESLGGNIRDLMLYMVTFHKRKRMFIHLLGGNSMKQILTNKQSLLFAANKFFISRLGGVIVEGGFQKEFYLNVTTDNKIHIVPNFAQKYLFSNEDEIEAKFRERNIIKLLFISNFLFGKGHEELLAAFLQMSSDYQKRFELHFAGAFENYDEEKRFIEKLSKCANIIYHGYVGGSKKAALFKSSHVFCLPTYYPFEGQPFVIVEAYAAGCAVMTTNHSGIGYIFQDKINGIEVERKSIESIKKALVNIIEEKYETGKMALYNHKLAMKEFTEERYIERIRELFNLNNN